MTEQIRAGRRQVVQGVAVATVAAPLLISCGADDGGGAADGTAAIRCGCHGSRYSIEDGSVINGPAPGPLEEKTVSTEGDRVSVDGADIAAKADIPEGGGTVFADDKVVVTQPEKDTFKAFTAVCTHQGCIVAEVVQA